MAGVAMAKKRATKGDGGKASGKTRTLAVRMTFEFAAWLGRAAKHNGDTIAAFLIRGAIKQARDLGFDEPPPERLP
jgi:hypothetical protein